MQVLTGETDSTHSEENTSNITNVEDDSAKNLQSPQVSVLGDKILSRDDETGGGEDDEMLQSLDDDANKANFSDHKEEEADPSEMEPSLRTSEQVVLVETTTEEQDDNAIRNEILSKDKESTFTESAIEGTYLLQQNAPTNEADDFKFCSERDLAKGGKNEGSKEQQQHSEVSMVTDAAKESEISTTASTREITDQIVVEQENASSDAKIHMKTFDGNPEEDTFLEEPLFSERNFQAQEEVSSLSCKQVLILTVYTTQLLEINNNRNS